MSLRSFCSIKRRTKQNKNKTKTDIVKNISILMSNKATTPKLRFEEAAYIIPYGNSLTI